MSYKKKKYFGRKKGPSKGHKSFDPRRLIAEFSSVKSLSKAPVQSVSKGFEDFALSQQISSAIKYRKFSTPTEIQEKTIPLILSGKDVVGISQTGTGKTAAFLIPLIDKALKNKNSRTLTIAPTRELAVQINEELRQFCGRMKISSTVCIGGANIQRQIKSLYAKPQFVIGTPGRLLDLSDQKKLALGTFDTVVLDEVDRMLDMGFIHDIRKIVSDLDQNRQTLFFSATLDKNTKSLMQQFLKNPAIVTLGDQERPDIDHRTVSINGGNKNSLLANILDDRDVVKTIVFARTKRKVDELSRNLGKVGFRTAVIHGNRSQRQRQRSLDDFTHGKVDILVATDVAARGIDVDDITHVINYDLPQTKEDYIHRTGRTGRNGKKGVAISFVG